MPSPKVADRLPAGRRQHAGATHSLYEVSDRTGWFLIDRQGILRRSVHRHNLDEWIERLLAE